MSSLYLSVLSLGELRKCIEVMTDQTRRLKLLDWLDSEVPVFFTGRILSVDASVADRWGRLQAKAQPRLSAIDALLAATAPRRPFGRGPRTRRWDADIHRVRNKAEGVREGRRTRPRERIPMRGTRPAARRGPRAAAS